jgi:hypothetical protein
VLFDFRKGRLKFESHVRRLSGSEEAMYRPHMQGKERLSCRNA